jgi:anti-sigma-K factor RskA
MNVHEEFAENLALYALGSLERDERLALEKHLEECAGCRRELDLLRGDMSLAHSRQRLMRAIGRERRTRSRSTRHWLTVVPWLAAAALAILAFVVWRSNVGLREAVSRLRQHSADQQAQLEKARSVVTTLTSTDAMRVTLVAAKTPPQPQGKAFYVRDLSSLVLIATNLPSLPAGKAYELWLIPTSGAPLPAGVFRPDAHGSATVLNPPLPRGVEAKTFAITVEPEQGSSAPTSQPVMLGSGE